ncbi:MAG: GTPase Era [Spirochaetaceae bacterium]|nr:GTPase Era [Spirochaetaceae bacterium]
MNNFKAGFVAIVGRPSAGKSSLINSLTGYKTAIVSPLPQTTRRNIRAIVNKEQGQIVFIDTPGMHKSDKKINHYLFTEAKRALEDADAILYLIDVSRKLGPEEEEVAKLVAGTGKTKLVAFNKIDKEDAVRNLPFYNQFIKHFLPDITAVHISAQEKTGLNELTTQLIELLPESEALYPAEMYTDQQPTLRISEILREQAIKQLRNEVPHALYIDIADMEMRGSKLWVRLFMVVERESQKAMLIGREGLTLRKIRVASLKELSLIFPYKIELDIKVKADKAWRNNDDVLKKLFMLN